MSEEEQNQVETKESTEEVVEDSEGSSGEEEVCE